jgi:hypothetical protein
MARRLMSTDKHTRLMSLGQDATAASCSSKAVPHGWWRIGMAEKLHLERIRGKDYE